MTHPSQIEDTLDCGSPQETWEALVAHLMARAFSSEQIGLSLERDARDAMEQADEHHRAAQEFHALARALENAPVTFAAKAIEAQRAETVKQGSVADESAVAESDLPTPSGSDPQEKVGI